ncbi:NUDIX domain-containing protein [Sphingomonas sp. RB3P16]|uniref:NUDIX domain-containing protein n=1 Tax=Parasphingomonas frigoris TaxID=3096163 RepID=UPI002FCC51A2
MTRETCCHRTVRIRCHDCPYVCPTCGNIIGGTGDAVRCECPARQAYVAGFLFSADRNWLALIRKQKPKWQVGKLNGIGGKIEPGETPLAAMIREFAEEGGVVVTGWQPVAVLTGSDFIVHFFAAFSDVIDSVMSMEAEQIEIRKTNVHLRDPMLMANLGCLIPLALDRSGIVKPVIMTDGIPEASQQRGATA